MPSPVLIRSSFWEGDDPGWTLAQLIDKNGAALLPAAVTSIAANVYDVEDGSLIYGPVVVVVATVVLPSFQHAGTLWTEDDIGCNFAAYLTDAAVFATTEAEGGHSYRIEYDLTTTSSGNISVVHQLACRSKYTQ